MDRELLVKRLVSSWRTDLDSGLGTDLEQGSQLFADRGGQASRNPRQHPASAGREPAGKGRHSHVRVAPYTMEVRKAAGFTGELTDPTSENSPEDGQS